MRHMHLWLGCSAFALASAWIHPALGATPVSPIESQSVSYEVGRSPWAVAVGDLDQDGGSDLVIANAESPGWITVMRGDGGGHFVLTSTAAVGQQPLDVTLADFDGDGLLDAATANRYSASVSLLFGLGGGALGNRADVTVGDYPQALCHGDFNQDGKEDLVVASAGSTTSVLSVLLGAGDGTFPNRTDFPCGPGPRSIAAADFDEDGNLDVVIVYGDAMCAMLGDGQGSLGPCATRAVGYGPCSVAVGDLNLDGRADVVTANCQSVNISTLLGLGDGTFGTVAQMNSGTQPASVAVDEMNGDGFPDWIVTAGGHLTVIFGNGQGGEAGRQSLSVGAGAGDVATGHFSLDGRLDVVTANSSGLSGSISIALADGSNVFRLKRECPIDAAGASFVWGELNGDAAPDFVVCFHSSNYLKPWLGNGDGSFTPGVSIGGAFGPGDAVLTDLDRDGRQDLAFLSGFPPLLTVRLGTGTGMFGPRADYPVGSNPVCITAADLDQDGKQDLIAAARDSVWVFLGDGAGGLDPPSPYRTGFAPRDVACADLDQDGTPDLVTANSIANSVSMLRGLGDGSFAPRVDFPTGRYPLGIDVADCNGDGFLDVATANSSSGTASVLFGNGTTTLTPAVHYPVGRRPEDIALADLDGDGHLELLTANVDANTLSILLGTPTGAFDQGRFDLAAGDSPFRIGVTDFDGNGRPDVAVLSATGHEITFLPNRGAYVSVDALPEERAEREWRVFPNPARNGLSFEIETTRATTPSLWIVDLAGRIVRRVFSGRWEIGHHHLDWDGRDEQGRRLPSGVYFGVLDLSGRQSVRRVILMSD